MTAGGTGILVSKRLIAQPERQLSEFNVAVLSNDWRAELQPEYVAKRLAAIAIGKPIIDSTIIRVAAKLLEKYVGRYRDDDGEDNNGAP